MGVIAASLALVLSAGTRLKRVADVLAMLGSWCGLGGAVASHYSVRLWLLRLGLYQLTRPKVQAGDWMWIIDHTMQLGERKCLLVVGIRQSAWGEKDRVLSYEDVDLIDLVPVTESRGQVVSHQRSKSRYLNLDVLVDWARESLLLLDCPRAMRKAGLNPLQVEAKLGWLRKFVPQVRRWGEMLDLIGITEHYVRHQGIHRQAAEELAGLLDRPATPAACQLRKELLQFVAEQGHQAGDQERLLGSSEVLESLIGKFKHLAGEGGHHGLTGMVLSIGALVGKLTVATIESAMTEIPTYEVWNWCRSHLGATVQSVRQKLRQALHPEQNQKTLSLENK